MSSNYDLSKLSVLLVDDNYNTRRLLYVILRSLGIETVVEAVDGTDAFARFEQGDYDLVVTDQVMEPMDGLELTQKIRRDAAGNKRYTPIIMVTGHTEAERVLAARDAGVTEVLAKPVSANSILQRIVSVIENQRDFVDAEQYVGPDRRRFKLTEYDGSKRRAQDSVGETTTDPTEDNAVAD